MAETSKDRNKDIRNKLLKKKEEDAQRRAGLAPGEMVDDALARGMASFFRWLRGHTALMQGAVVAAILAGSGFAYYQHRVEKRAEAVSSALFKGVRSDLGKISPSPKTEEEAMQDPTPSWRSTEDRRTAALGSYRKAMTTHQASGAAILARFGEAGLLFEQNNWDGAITALREVKASPLAKADASVRARAAELEGQALEAKGDLDGALKAFREVQNTDLRGLRELGMYEQARILYGRGDAAGAKNLLVSVREKLHPKSEDSASGPSAEQKMLPFLSSQVDDLLRRIDPSSVTTGGRAGGSKMSPADLERLQEQFKRQMKEAQGKAEREKGQTPTEAPGARLVGGAVNRVARHAWRLLLIALGLSGCETLQSGANPARPLWVHRPIGALRVLVHRPLTAPAKIKGEEYERGRPEIDAVRHRVFVGSSDHGLYALSSDTGEIGWRFETLGPVQCEPLYDAVEDSVYFGSNDGALYKVAAVDGRLLWRFMSNAEVSRKPVLSNGLLFAVNANDTLVALDPQSGKLRWVQHRTPAMGMEISGHAGPLVMAGTVFTAFSDGNVAAFNARDGSEKWPPVDLSAEAEQSLGEIPKYLDVDTTPVPGTVAGGPVIYVASYAGGVFALDALTGNRVWGNDRAAGVTDLVLWNQRAHAPRDGQGPREPARSLLLASSGGTGLWALSPEDGREIWRRALPEGGISAPVPVAGAVLVSTSRYGLHLFSPLDGGVIDGIDLSGGLSMTPAVKGHHAYVVSNTGTLIGLYVDAPRQPVDVWQAL